MSTKVSFFDVEAWSLRFGGVGFVLAALAAAVPQWIYTVPDSVTFGLRATCFGDKCQALDFEKLRTTLNCNKGCDDALDQFRLRWRAIEAFSWLGVALCLLLAGCLRIGYTREVRPQALGAPHVLLTIVIIAALGIALAIMGGSLSCGSGCFEYGASVICKFIAVAVVIFTLPVGLIASYSEKLRVPLARLAFGMIILAAAFEMAGLLSNRWIFTTTSNTNGVLNAKSIGLFQSCIDNSCSALNYNDLLSPSGNADASCPRDGSQLQGRFIAGAALHFVSGAFCIAFMVVAYKKVEGYARFILVSLALTLSTVGNAVIFNTLEGWMFCEQTYCGYVSRLGNNTACEWGFSAAAALCVNIGLGILFITHLVEMLYQTCGVEETEGQGLLKLQKQEEFDRREAARIKQEEAEEAERTAKKEKAAEELRALVAEREAAEAAEAAEQIKKAEAAEAEAEKLRKEKEENDNSSAAALVAAAAAVTIDEDEKQQQQEQTANDQDEDTTAVNIAEEEENETNNDDNHEPFEEEQSAGDLKAEPSVADRVASGDHVPVSERAKMFEQQQQQDTGADEAADADEQVDDAEAEKAENPLEEDNAEEGEAGEENTNNDNDEGNDDQKDDNSGKKNKRNKRNKKR